MAPGGYAFRSGYAVSAAVILAVGLAWYGERTTGQYKDLPVTRRGNQVAAQCRLDGHPVVLPEVPEASGLVASRRTPGLLWTHNDSGNAILFGVDAQGVVTRRVRLSGVSVTDWEDVAIAPCPSGACVYAADIGDNHADRSHITVLRFAEPAASESTTGPVESFNATYPDGPRDAEALFVTPEGQVFLITKEVPAQIYGFPMPLKAGTTVSLRRIGAVPDGNAGASKLERARPGKITGASMSPNGRWVALRSHNSVEFFRTGDLTSGRPTDPLQLDVTSLHEPQGEGIAFGDGGEVYLAGEGGGKGRPGTFARLVCALPN